MPVREMGRFAEKQSPGSHGPFVYMREKEGSKPSPYTVKWIADNLSESIQPR